MYAVMMTGGKQYKVSPGEVIFVELLSASEGQTISFEPMLIAREGQDAVIGTPTIAGAKVNAKVLGSGRGEKIVIFKYKSKKNERKKQGHRQPYTRLEIVSIEG